MEILMHVLMMKIIYFLKSVLLNEIYFKKKKLVTGNLQKFAKKTLKKDP